MAQAVPVLDSRADVIVCDELPKLEQDVIIMDEVEDEAQPVPFKMARLSKEVKSWYARKDRLSKMWVEDEY